MARRQQAQEVKKKSPIALARDGAEKTLVASAKTDWSITMHSYISGCGIAILLLPALASVAPLAAEEPATSAMTCRLYLRVRALPEQDPVLMLREFGSKRAKIVIGVPSGAILEPLDHRIGKWQAVRWNGAHIGFVHTRYTEDFAHCVPAPNREQRPQVNAGLAPAVTAPPDMPRNPRLL